jgi:peptide chain release factor 1
MNNKSVILEIRPAAGGEEAKIWATDLLRMYLKFSQKQGWETKTIGDGVLRIKGADAFLKLKHEAGVHRVQRVPETEKYGRIHTSTATVAVLPTISETQIKIDPKDIEFQAFRASTQGGQNVQKVSTAVRLIHKPTSVTATCQTQRTQEQNRKIALEMLRAKLYQIKEEKRRQKLTEIRQTAVGRGMRAEKIRTYNYPQNRVTDHRINKKFRLEDIIEGKLGKMIKHFTR